ncbi:ribonuclease III domain-containing protein [Amylocystis lapponica]|nr:ribonuclease III domain-containing protein [Amylocystis lapponica]
MVVKSSRDLTDVQDYLNQVKNRPHIRNVPSLNKDLLIRARNGIRHSVDNNDLLEFIGDRALNLIGALLVERDKLSKAHHTAVRQVVCNNDTFGRLGFYLKLHAHAHLSAQDNKIIDSWNPLCPEAPPKVLADLFEAYAGAVYIQHGWQRLSSWLSALLEPIVRRATGDYWLSARPEQIFGIPAHPAHTLPCPETRSQGTLLDYVVFKRNWLAEQGTNAVRALPRGTRFRFEKKGWLCAPDCERLEVAVHLINMWICRIVIGLWPEYHQATSKAAHILSVSSFPVLRAPALR